MDKLTPKQNLQNQIQMLNLRINFAKQDIKYFESSIKMLDKEVKAII